MSLVPRITSVDAVAGLTPVPDVLAHPSHLPGGAAQAVHVAIIVDDRPPVWGYCPAVPTPPPGYPDPFTAEAAIEAVRLQVAPALEGQPAADLPALVERVEGLREVVTLRRPAPPGDEKVLSRRALLSGSLTPQRPVFEETVERSLHPTIRYGVSQALLRAVAQAQATTALALLGDLLEQPAPASPIPLSSTIGAERATELARLLLPGALRIAWAGRDPLASFGSNGALVQRYVRQLVAYLEAGTPASYRPFIYLELDGGLGRLLKGNLGRVLGLLYGMERVAGDYPIVAFDPLPHEEGDDHRQQMVTLHHLCSMRGLSLRLGAGAPLQSAGAVRAYLAEGGVDAVRLSPPFLGSILETAGLILEARRQEIHVLLDGHGDPALCPLALVTRPDALAPGGGYEDGRLFATFFNEMNRQLALA